MFLVSCPQLVVAACRSGVIGAFPTLNARSTQVLSDWLEQIGRDTEGAAPYAANMILDKSNKRFDADFKLVRERRVPIVIASVGKPDRVIEPVHAYGGIVFADVATLLRIPEKATTLSGAWRPRDPVDDDQGGARA
jgi:nitronate monooxygenase